MNFIERGYLFELHRQLDHVNYGWGSKALFQTPPNEIDQLDCSGYVRYILFHVSDGKIKMPAGSWNQNLWCSLAGLAKCRYGDAVGLADDTLRIAFIRPEKTKRIQHVWLVVNRVAMESHGSKGVNSRSAATEILLKNADDCYTIAKLYMMTIGPATLMCRPVCR